MILHKEPIKGFVHLQIKIVSSFTHPHVFLNPQDFYKH